MSSETKRSGGLFTSLLALTFVLLIAAGVGAYAMGWMTIEHQDDITTVEMNTGEVQRSAEQAAESGRELLDQAAEGIQETAQDVDEAVSDESASEEDDVSEDSSVQPEAN